MKKLTTSNESLRARDAVLATHELFETILDQLPFLDLVLVTRVNQYFHRFIGRSKKLKRKLFILPIASTKHELNKYGVVGSSITQESLMEDPILEPVNLLPYFLVNSSFPKTAHLSERAVRSTCLPYDKHLTNPPCAHLTVHFTYVCVAPDGTHIQLEAIRSSYRAKGVTLLSVEQMLAQRGAVKVLCGQRTKFKAQNGSLRTDSTMHDEIDHFERLYDCKMKIHLPQTTLTLYANILPQEADAA